MSDTKKPAARVQLFPVSVAVWANTTAKGTFYSATLQACYKDEKGKWQNSDRLNENELLLAAKALDMAHSEILRLRAEARKQTDEDA